MRISKKSIIYVLIIVLFLFIIQNSLIKSYSGPNFINDPFQGDFIEDSINHRDLNGNIVELTLLAEYRGNFAIKGVKKYSTDAASTVSPRDYILAWGDLLKKDVNKEIKYSQSNRWYHFTYSKNSLVDSKYISQHSSNTHIIPKNELVLSEIKKVKANDYIYLEGYLAVVHFENGDWKSSLTRDDIGDGACEIFYVTDIIRKNH